MAGYQNDPGLTQQEAGFGFFGRFWTESFNNITAKPGGGLSGATLIDSMFVSVTVGSAGDSAVLPDVTFFPGGALIICVQNVSTNAMQVFAQGTNTINGQAGSSGIQQIGNSIAYYQCTKAGAWQASGLGVGFGTGNSAAFPTYAAQDNITAHAGGGQANAVPITSSQARITTVGTAADSVVLPPAIAGMEIAVLNDAAANACNVFPASQAQGGVSGGDSIDNGAQNAAKSLTAQNQTGTGPTIFYCFTTGKWRTK